MGNCRVASTKSDSPEEALQRTAAHLQKMANPMPSDNGYESMYRRYLMQSANALKVELKIRNLPDRGRKPDLAKRLAEYEWQQEKQGRHDILFTPSHNRDDDIGEADRWIEPSDREEKTPARALLSFCGLALSEAAGRALGKAQFEEPTPIQKASIPLQLQGESLIIHAETGSGKTLAYLLPITEQMWLEQKEGVDEEAGYGIILTPTRELAAQVAGIATVLAPPGMVRMVSRPTNLMSDGLKDRGEELNGGRLERNFGRTKPRLFVGSAKAIMYSLYGDGKMPASPTTKPEALHLLRHVRWLVLDEVDRLLSVKSPTTTTTMSKRHERPAAVVTAAVARLTLGRAQTISASATVGRSLKRELTRVLGLAPHDCPQVVRGTETSPENSKHVPEQQPGVHVGRAVTIPDTVTNYVTPVDSSSSGKLLTTAFYLIKQLNKKDSRRMLLVLTRRCGINTQTAIGALRHFRCEPEPISLLDALEADGTDRMIEKHREVSGATGIGESYFSQTTGEKIGGYLFVTGEDTVRGLHLDGLDIVIVVGRAHGPDEYTHIAGRTGRAGQLGKVINVVSLENAAAMTAWEKMLDVQFERLEVGDAENLE